LQVAYNPGIPIFIIASLLLVGGLVVTFYFPLRRIRAIASEGPHGAMLTAVPLAKRDWSGKREFFRTIDAIGEQLAVEPTRKKPAAIADWEPISGNASAG
ncbi:MAG: cytochrome c biogenesis protein ResB, partial [Thermomicrobiales bacterium]